MDCDKILDDLESKEQEIDDKMEELDFEQETKDNLNSSIDQWLEYAYSSYKEGDEGTAEIYMDKAAADSRELYGLRNQNINEINSELKKLEQQASHLRDDYCKCKDQEIP